MMSQFKRKKPYYSESFKKSVIRQIIHGNLSILEAQRHYEIGSGATIYRWLDKYETMVANEDPKDLDSVSDSEKSISALSAELASLKRLLELERLRSESYLQMIKLAEEQYGILIEKKSGAKRSNE